MRYSFFIYFRYYAWVWHIDKKESISMWSLIRWKILYVVWRKRYTANNAKKLWSMKLTHNTSFNQQKLHNLCTRREYYNNGFYQCQFKDNQIGTSIQYLPLFALKPFKLKHYFFHCCTKYTYVCHVCRKHRMKIKLNRNFIVIFIMWLLWQWNWFNLIFLSCVLFTMLHLLWF